MFWIYCFRAVVGVISFLSGISGWFHDRVQQKIGAQAQVITDQHAAIQTMKAVLVAPRVETKADLEQTLKDGKL